MRFFRRGAGVLPAPHREGASGPAALIQEEELLYDLADEFGSAWAWTLEDVRRLRIEDISPMLQRASRRRALRILEAAQGVALPSLSERDHAAVLYQLEEQAGLHNFGPPDPETAEREKAIMERARKTRREREARRAANRKARGG